MYYKVLFDWIKCGLSILLAVSWCVIQSTSLIFCKYVIYGIYKNPNVNLFNSWKYLTSVNEVFPIRQPEIIMIFVKLKCLMIFKKNKSFAKLYVSRLYRHLFLFILMANSRT